MTQQWKRYLAWGEEAAYGTAVATPYRMDILGESLSHRIRHEEQEPERSGAIERVSEIEHHAEGSIDLLPHFHTLVPWLTHLMGEPTSSSPAAGAYLREWIHDPQYAPTSRTLATYPDVRVHRYPGAFGRTLRLGTERARHFAITVGMLAKLEEAAGAIPSVSEAGFPPQYAPGSYGQGGFALGLDIAGTPVSGRGQFTADWIWNRRLRTAERFLGALGILTDGRVKLSGSLRWRFDSNTTARRDALLALSKLTLTATWTGTLITGSTYHGLQLYVPNAYIPKDSGGNIRGSGGPGSLDLSTDWMARADASLQGSPYRLRLTNRVPPPTTELLINGSFEAATITDAWTQVQGSGASRRTNIPPGPQAGTYYGFPGQGATCELRQDVDVSGLDWWIDLGVQQFTFRGYTSSLDQAGAGSDSARMIVEYRSAAGAVLDSYDTGVTVNLDVWVLYSNTRTAPALTRTIRVRLVSVRHSGTNTDGYYDSLSLVNL